MEECLRKIKHIGIIILPAVTFYMLFGICEHMVIGDLIGFVKEEFTIPGLIAFLLFNGQLFVGGHLWFLFALLYVYLAYAVIIKLKLKNYSKYLCVVLLLLHFILAYGSFFIGYALKAGFYRNWLFEGLPFFLFGKIFYENSDRWSEKQKLKYKGLLLIVVGLISSVMERIALGRDFSVHIGSVIALEGMLMWAVDGSVPFGKKLIFIGRELSVYVYIYHLAIYMLFDYLYKILKLNQNIVVFWIRPINTLLWSIVVAYTIYFVLEKRKNIKKI